MGLLSGIASLIFGGQKKTTNSKGGGTTSQTMNQTQAPYAPVIPYLNDYLGKTSALYNGGAPQISPYEQQGYDMLKGIATGPQATDAAIAANNKTLSGYYLDPSTNPWIKDIAARAAGEAATNANSNFEGAGRTGSGLAGYYSGKGAAEAADNLYYQNYGDERSRMMAAAGMAPSLEQAQYDPAQAMISAGQNISARPYDINSQYGGILSSIGGLGQQTTGQSTGNYTNWQDNYAHNPGIVGSILNSFTNKLFPNNSSGPF